MPSLALEIDLIRVLTKWTAFLVFNYIFTAVRNVLWVFNGTYWQLRRSQKAEAYNKGAHVLKIVCQHRLDEEIVSRVSDFVLVHDRFDSPELVLGDDVTLLTLTKTDAVFVQKKASAPDPFYLPFLILGQMDSAERVIILPLVHFHKLADTISNKPKVVVIHNHARCGSTLLTNIFKDTEHCLGISEPHVLKALGKYGNVEGVWGGEEGLVRMYRNVFRFLTKPYQGLGNPPLAYAIKTTLAPVCWMDIIEKAVPNVTQLFIYRNPVRSSISLRRLGEYCHTLRTIYYFPRLHKIRRLVCRNADIHGDIFQTWIPSHNIDIEFGYLLGMFCMHQYTRGREAGVEAHAIRFEDLIAHKEAMTKNILATCGLPETLVQKGMRSFDRDSEAMSGASMDNLTRLNPNPPKPDERFLKAARALSDQHGLPPPEEFGDEFHLPGSILP